MSQYPLSPSQLGLAGAVCIRGGTKRDQPLDGAQAQGQGERP